MVKKTRAEIRVCFLKYFEIGFYTVGIINKYIRNANKYYFLNWVLKNKIIITLYR